MIEVCPVLLLIVLLFTLYHNIVLQKEWKGCYSLQNYYDSITASINRTNSHWPHVYFNDITTAKSDKSTEYTKLQLWITKLQLYSYRTSWLQWLKVYSVKWRSKTNCSISKKWYREPDDTELQWWVFFVAFRDFREVPEIIKHMRCTTLDNRVQLFL